MPRLQPRTTRLGQKRLPTLRRIAHWVPLAARPQGEDHDTYMRPAVYWYDAIGRGGTGAGKHHKTPPKKQEALITPKFFSDYIHGWGKSFLSPNSEN